MRNVPNNTVSELCRYLPVLLDNLDKPAVQKSLRLRNAVRIIKHQIIPKLKKIDKDKKMEDG